MFSYVQHCIKWHEYVPAVSVFTLLGNGLRAAVCPSLPGIHETCP